MKQKSFLNESKLYTMRLVGSDPTIFGDYVDSNHLELFADAMDNDLHKVNPLVFRHPKLIELLGRKYLLCPANGNTLMAVGKFKDQMDFAYVFLLLNSKKYKRPYMVLERYSKVHRNPDVLADMVASAFNWVLKDKGVKVVFEPWDTKGQPIYYLKDGWDSWNLELFLTGGRNLIRKGYEDALEMDKKEAEAAGMPVGSRKSDDIRVYIKSGYDKNRVIEFLRLAVKGMTAAREIAMPFRFLLDREITTKIPYKAVIKAFPELEGLIKERRYNNWTNPYSTSYDGDDRYETMNGLVEMIL